MSNFIRRHKDSFRLTMTGKLRLSIGAIVALLLLTMVISIFEFRRMSTYVSDLISDNVETITLTMELAVSMDEYNLNILNAVGRADEITKSNIDTAAVSKNLESLLEPLSRQRYSNTDSLVIKCNEYFATTRQLDSIIVNDFVDTRDWYFTKLQPEYNDFRRVLEAFNMEVYDDLGDNSVSFDASFYRSIMPSVISVATAIMLCLLLQFFIMVYYVRPLRHMCKSLNAYNQNSLNYSVKFEGDDDVQQLNDGITEIVEENRNLKNRLRSREY